MTTPELYAQHVLPTYGRFPLVPVRGAGARLWDDDGKKLSGFLHGHRRVFARPLPSDAGRGDPPSGGRADACFQSLSKSAPGGTRRGNQHPPRAPSGENLFLQLRCRGERRPDQIRPPLRPQAPAGRWLAALRGGHVPAILPRPHARRDVRHRTDEDPGGLRSPAARLPPSAVQRHRRA